MKALFSAFFLFTLITACSQPDAGAETDATAEAKNAFEAYVDAINEGDTDAIASFYDMDPDFHWIERGGIQYDSTDDAIASLGQLGADGGRSKMTVDTMRVADLGNDAALVSAHFDFTMLAESGEPQWSFDGWMTVGLVKRADGWRIAGGQVGPGANE